MTGKTRRTPPDFKLQECSAGGDHLHGPRKRCFSVYACPRLGLPVGQLEPLARHDLPMVSQAGEQMGSACASTPDQRPQQRAELRSGERGWRRPSLQAAVELGGDVQQLVQQGLHPLFRVLARKNLGRSRDAVKARFPLSSTRCSLSGLMVARELRRASPATKRTAPPGRGTVLAVLSPCRRDAPARSARSALRSFGCAWVWIGAARERYHGNDKSSGGAELLGPNRARPRLGPYSISAPSAPRAADGEVRASTDGRSGIPALTFPELRSLLVPARKIERPDRRAMRPARISKAMAEAFGVGERLSDSTKRKGHPRQSRPRPKTAHEWRRVLP